MMIPWKPIVTALSVAGSAWCAAVLDCDPRLYFYERFFFDATQAYGGSSSSDDGPTIWIIGASSGIGKEMAFQLAQARCRRLILSGRNQASLEQVADQCRQLQFQQGQQQQHQQQQHQPTTTCSCHSIPFDVANHERMEQVVHEVELLLQSSSSSSSSSSLSSLDMVVLNAGAGQLCPALETDANVVQRVLQVNAVWPMILMPLLLRRRRRHDNTNNESNNNNNNNTAANNNDYETQNTPRFLVTSSVAAKFPLPLSATYAASKAALHQYFLSLAAERPDLKIDLVCPGPIDTPFFSNQVDSSSSNGGETTTTSREKTGSPNNQDTPHTTTTTTTIDDDDDGSGATSSSPLKMSVRRCVRLMLASAAMRNFFTNRGGGLTEHWIAEQPVLAGLYLNQIAPNWMRPIYGMFGRKRIELWRNGVDLYDPKFWTQRKKK
ncbi:hypothetical protein ACA910_017088 [Epithemia clementina (nom. ined.)]